MEYRVEIRVRGLVPKHDMNSGQVVMVRGDYLSHVTVDVPEGTPRDLQASTARSLAVAQKAAELGDAMKHSYLSCHDTVPVCEGDGNAGNPSDGRDDARMPLPARRGDYGKTAPRVGGRFA